MKPIFSCRQKNPYNTRDQLYLCAGGVYSKGKIIIPESCDTKEAIEEVTGKPYVLGSRSQKWETKQTDEWFKRQYAALGEYKDLGLWWLSLPYRSAYRVRAGVKDNVQWAYICIEFRYFSDFSTKEGDRTMYDPGVLLFWEVLDDACEVAGAFWDVIDSSPNSGLVYHPALPTTVAGIEQMAKESMALRPGTACVVADEKKLSVARVEAHHGRPEWQIEARFPISNLTFDYDTGARLDEYVESTLDCMAHQFSYNGVNKRMARKAVDATVVHLI